MTILAAKSQLVSLLVVYRNLWLIKQSAVFVVNLID